ncbi:MAG: epoxyqueuosine reductase [Chloroflexi bacterium]|nr:epoxyqueuosine reductase [Chloroflexota bacterium]
MAASVQEEIRAFVRSSPINRMPDSNDDFIFDEPLVQFADGDDPIFNEYKTIIDRTHITPREALSKTYEKSPEDLPAHLSVISWILPITAKTRKSNRPQKDIPSCPWAYTRWYGEKFNEALRKHIVEVIVGKGYLAVAPFIQPYFKTMENEKGFLSNWSERHIAYAAGLGTFSLSDGFITERGIAHRCGSVVTDMPLPTSPRTAKTPYSNCLFYVNNKCWACIPRCPAGAITEQGHDKIRCRRYMWDDIAYIKQKYGVDVQGCGLCQTKVPCEFRNPAEKLSIKTG